MDVFSFLVVASFERVDSYAFVSADETAYLDAADGDCSLNRKWRSWSVLRNWMQQWLQWLKWYTTVAENPYTRLLTLLDYL